MRDPVLASLPITISEVRTSPDLRQATVYVTPLGGGHQSEVVSALNRSAPYLRGLLGREIALKFTPALRFVGDETFAEARRIDELLASPAVARDLARDRKGD